MTSWNPSIPQASEQLRQDIRFSLRTLRESPGFSITAILTLALGIGANTAIFSLIDSVMLRSLPVSHPEQLLEVSMTKKDLWGMENPFLSNPVWEQLRDRQNVFSQVFAASATRLNLAPRGEERNVQANYASGNFFETLGLRATLGRTFTRTDDQRGCVGTAVLSYGFWQREYGGRTDIAGNRISLNNHPFEILGVLAPGFTGIDVGRNSDLYIPLCAEKILTGENSSLDDRSAVWLAVFGRPKPGIAASQVEARLQTWASSINEATLPPNLRPDQRQTYLQRGFRTALAANGSSTVRANYSRALIIMMGMVGVVLLIACANVANLLLARGTARQREIAIRIALGSGRARLVRQLLTESLILALTGAALGVLFAHSGAQLLVGLLASNVYQENRVFLDLSVNLRVLAFTVGIAAFTALLFGLAPAWKGTRVNPQETIKTNARGVIEGGRFGLGKLLVVAQVALSLTLITGAGLMLSTFFSLETLNPGFDRERILLTQVTIRATAARHPSFQRILERLRTTPGVRSVSYSDVTPVDGSISAGYVQMGSEPALIYFNLVSDHFFQTLGTPLLAGRDFNVHDTIGSPKVAIINQTLAKKLFLGRNPIGLHYQPVENDKPSDPVQIIGLVQDAKYSELRDDVPATAYVAASQNANPGDSFTFELRTATDPSAALISSVNSAIMEVNPDASLQFRTLASQLDESLSRERLLATLSGFFAALALLLAMIGLYGVTAYSVIRRRNEIGIRMALGAPQSRVLRTVLGEVAILIAIGLAIGIAATVGVSRFIAAFLYGVKPNDPWTIFGASILLTLVAALAGFLPARRASRIDPMTALREE